MISPKCWAAADCEGHRAVRLFVVSPPLVPMEYETPVIVE